MKKVNFNSLENFEVPEEWIEKALNAKPKKKILFRPYVLGTAASLVLVTVLSLLFFKPFKQISDPPIPVSVTETTAATEATSAPITATEKPAETEEPAETEAEPSTEEPVESQIDPTDPQEIEPEPTEQTDDPSKVRVDNNWRVHAKGQNNYPMNIPVPNSASIIPESSTLIPKDELFTGYITIIVSPDSPYYYEDVFYLDIKGHYSSDSIEVGGTVVLEPTEIENGEKTVSFNLFNKDVCIPSTEYTFLFYTDSNNDYYFGSKTLTESLYYDNSVTITI